MLKAGLIKKSNGFSRLTAVGVVMYEVCLRIDAASLEYSELNAIDSLKNTVNIGDSGQHEFVLIEDEVFSSTVRFRDMGARNISIVTLVDTRSNFIIVRENQYVV